MKTLLIVIAIAVCGCIYDAQRRHHLWLEKRDEDRQQRMELMRLVKEKNEVDAQRLQRQLDIIERISDKRRAEIQAAQAEDDALEKRKEIWKDLIPR